MQNMAGRAGHVTQDRSLPFLDPASLQGGEELPGGRELCQLGGFQALQPLVKCGFPSGWSRQAQRTCTSNSPQGCWCGPHAMAEEDWVPVGVGVPQRPQQAALSSLEPPRSWKGPCRSQIPLHPAN